MTGITVFNAQNCGIHQSGITVLCFRNDGSESSGILIANKFDFDGKVLAEALGKTFVNREHTFTIEQFEQVMSFADDSAMQKKWKAFCRKIDTKTDDFSTVLKTIKVFLTKPFIAAVRDKEFTEKWSAANVGWM